MLVSVNIWTIHIDFMYWFYSSADPKEKNMQSNVLILKYCNFNNYSFLIPYTER